ncbi:MAG TPA: tetratricopeptide repeat protein [Blastocatellia bacterium]|nr:tetratricopeptide repeat protein [Blastocatellia bacterium]
MRLVWVTLLSAFFLLSASQSTAQPPLSNSGKTTQSASAFEEGQNAQERGDHGTAVRLYTIAINADPKLFQAYYQRGVALAALGRATDAEADFRKVIELEPAFARAHRGLGQVLLDRGATEDAKREFARTLELDPKLTGVRSYYASALIKSGEPATAVLHLRAAIEQGEGGAITFALLGLAEERLGKLDDAFADYSRAIQLEPASAAAREGRARLFEGKGDTARAIEDYTLAYTAQPSAELAYKLARLHAQAGQLQAAIHLLRGLIVEKPESLELRVELARLMTEHGQGDEALKDLDKLIAAQPRNAKLLAAAGDLCFKERPAAAAGYYSRALESDPTDNRLRVQLGASRVRSMEFEAALPILSDAVAREPDNYQAHANLATALFKLKQYLPAAREFLWVLQKNPQVAASYYFLAICLDRIGDCEQAFRAYQEFVRRADPAANKDEIEDANIRLSLLQKLVKENKCKSPMKGKGK